MGQTEGNSLKMRVESPSFAVLIVQPLVPLLLGTRAPSLFKKFCLVFFFFFAMLCGLWDLNSPTRD